MEIPTGMAEIEAGRSENQVLWYIVGQLVKDFGIHPRVFSQLTNHPFNWKSLNRNPNIPSLIFQGSYGN